MLQALRRQCFFALHLAGEQVTFNFDPKERFIAVNGAYSTGVAQGISVQRLLLDTGASTTVLRPLALSGLEI